MAVAILNREGHPAVLLRAGQDCCPFLEPDGSWGRKHSIEMGYMPHHQMPDLLAAADILVQPGRSDPFNDYRFPSKLPEFLAIGRPVVVPAANLGLHLKHGVDAFVLPKVDALAIVEATLRITGDSELYDRLAKGARDFFERRLSWGRRALHWIACLLQRSRIVIHEKPGLSPISPAFGEIEGCTGFSSTPAPAVQTSGCASGFRL